MIHQDALNSAQPKHECRELLTMFIVSDLHAVGGDTKDYVEESFLNNLTQDGRFRTPIARLHQMLDEKPLKADILVCCGDLTNRAGLDGFKFAWSELERLAGKLGCESIIFTPGNHDLDLHDRHNTGNPRVCLDTAWTITTLKPKPITDHRLESDHFEIYRPRPEITIINLDSNGRAPRGHMGKKGIVELDTVDSLGQALKGIKPTPCSVLICHHHPYRHGDIDLDDYSALENAPELLNMLSTFPNVHWLLLHGHKHMPRISRWSHRNFVVAAGSFSGSLYGLQQGVARHQCYLFSLVSDTALGDQHPPVCIFRAWDWAATKWIPALNGFGIPAQGGIGALQPVDELVREVASYVLQAPNKVRSAQDVTAKYPALKYLVPTDVLLCESQLLEAHNIEVLISRETGEWRQLGMKVTA